MNTARWFSEKFLWGGAAILMALLYVATAPHGWQCEASDEIEYLGLTHSLATGAGYTMNGQAYAYYPPLFSAFLALLKLIGFNGWWPLYAANALVGFAGLLVLSTQVRRSYGEAGRWASWFALVAYYAWSFSTRYLLAEQLVALFAAIAVVELDRGLGEDKPPLRSWIIVPLFVLFAAMTKASAAAVIASVGMAGGMAWLVRRNRAAFGLAVFAVLLGGGFMLGWEIRSQLVTPDAPESYGRWVLKWVGLSKETASVVARNAGEGIAGDASYAERAGVMANKIGTYLASVARPPDNFLPLSILLAALCLVGLVRLLLDNPSSPLGWYLLISILLGSLTFWASSYHRYLYPLTPLLFLACFTGISWSARHPILLLPFGVWGVIFTFIYGVTQDASGAEGRYRLAMGVFSLIVYVALTASPFFARRILGVRTLVLASLLALLVLHNAALMADRFRRTLQDEMPRQQGMYDVMACTKWIQENTSPEVRVISSLPRMTSFLTQRAALFPDDAGEVVLLFGQLRGVPPFQPDTESRLREKILGTGVLPSFASGASAVYIVKP